MREAFVRECTLTTFTCVCVSAAGGVRLGRWPCYQAEARGRVTQRASAEGAETFA